jgi:Mg-chelatase subunit ChlD
MLSLKSKGGLRTSVDLICVLDVSGSMKEDNRIKLLKETILLLINGKNG